MVYSKTNELRNILLTFHDDESEEYRHVDWELFNFCIREIKNNLFELTNDDSRTAYLKTVFLSLKEPALETWFREVEDYYQTTSEVPTARERAILRYIEIRGAIIHEISEHCSHVFNSINFSMIMKAVDYRVRTFWISPGTTSMNDLTAYEIALRHSYLVKYSKEEFIPPVEVGKKYSQYKNGKNIEDHYRDLESKKNLRQPKIKELQNVKSSLADFPDIQKAILNDIDRLK